MVLPSGAGYFACFEDQQSLTSAVLCSSTSGVPHLVYFVEIKIK